MLSWVQHYGHWGYIYLPLAATLILVLIDLLPPWLHQRKLRQDIRARLRREQHRSE